MCRFESYQAHNLKCQIVVNQLFGIFYFLIFPKNSRSKLLIATFWIIKRVQLSSRQPHPSSSIKSPYGNYAAKIINQFDMPRRVTNKTDTWQTSITFAEKDTTMARGYKTGGRKTGTPNKTTGLTKEMINQVLAAYHDDGRLTKDFDELTPKERLDVYIKLIGYILPKPQAVQVDLNHSSSNPSIVERLRQLAEENE